MIEIPCNVFFSQNTHLFRPLLLFDGQQETINRRGLRKTIFCEPQSRTVNPWINL